MQNSEIRLVMEAVAGSAEAFGQLTDQYSRVILGLAYSYVGDLEIARDIAQESLLKAWVSLGSIHRPERFGAWLRQIVANLARDYLRRQSRREMVPLDEWDSAAHEESDPVEGHLLREELLKHLEAVPAGPRTALVLRYLMGLAPAEAAQRLGISRASFDTRLFRGREALRRELTHLMNEALTAKQAEAQAYLEGLSDRVRAALTDGPRERASAARELALLAARANLERLVIDLTNPNVATRRTAARLMADTGDRRTIPHLLPLLTTDEEPAVQAEICRSLARLGALEAAADLKHLARQTSDMAVHKAATEAVRTLESLKSPLVDGDISVSTDDLREAGIEALLLAMIDDPSPKVRTQAADGLGRVESVKALPELISLLSDDPVEYVRLAAAEALGGIVGRRKQTPARITPKQQARAVEALAKALTDPYHGTVAEAARSLTLIDLTPTQKTSVIDALFAALPELLQRRPGAWWKTIPLLFGCVGGEAEMLRVAEIRLNNPAPIHNGPLAGALEHMAAPGRTAANSLMLAALKQEKRDPTCLLVALGRTQDPSIASAVAEFLAPGAIRLPKVWAAAAGALRQLPGGEVMLQAAIEAELKSAGLDEGPFLAAVEALEEIGGQEVAQWLAMNAGRLPPRVRIKARAAARRLGREEPAQ